MKGEDLSHGRHGRRTNVHVGMLVRDIVGVGAAYPDEGALVFGMFCFREFFQFDVLPTVETGGFLLFLR